MRARSSTGIGPGPTQQRDRVNLHAGQKLGDAADLRAFYIFAHVQEHLPGALTRAQFDTDPTQAVANNVTNRWGRDYDLQHVGLQYRAQLSPTQRLEISPYLQYRDIDHPIFEVISQISHDVGAEIRYENTADVAGRRNRFTVGLQPAFGRVGNRQYANTGGAHGALSRDELDRASTLALYAENGLMLTSRLTATAGFRVERSDRTVADRLLSNGDQSDARTFDAFSPRLGLLATTGKSVQLYANASRTVEPPLLLELTSFGNSGGFIPIDAQSAWQYEVGTRFESLGLSWDVSAYDIELTNELLNVNVKPFPTASFTVPSYRNSPATRHAGIEAGAGFRKWVGLLARGDVRDAIAARVAYTYNRFRFVDDPQFAGKRLPGAPTHFVSAELSYQHPSGFTLTPSIETVPGSYFLDSGNTVTNGPWSNVGLRAELASERLGTTLFVEGRNLTNRRYSGSAQMDNAAGQNFEPSDPRSIYAGLRWNR